MKLEAVLWPESRAGEALESLATSLGQIASPGPREPDHAVSGRYRIPTAASRLGLETQLVDACYPELESALRSLGPALVPIPGTSSLVVLLQGRRRRLRVLTPEGRRVWIQTQDLGAALAEPLVKRHTPVLERIGVAVSPKASAALLDSLLAKSRLTCGWMVRPAADTSFRAQVWAAGLPQRLALLTGAHLLGLVLWITSWWVMGGAALRARFDPGWMWAWILLLLTLFPLRGWITKSQGHLALSGGALLLRRLLLGALKLGPDAARQAGVGQVLGRVLESEALTALALAGGFGALFSGLELLAAGWVLWHGASGGLLLVLLGMVLALTLAQGWFLYGRRQSWTDSRLALTHELVELLLGHQTRLAQEKMETSRGREDDLLWRYVQQSRALDRQSAYQGLLPRLWLLLGTAGLLPAFVQGLVPQASLAIGLGGILLAFQGLRSLSGGLSQLIGAAIAWDRVRELFSTAGASPCLPAVHLPDATGQPSEETREPVLQARDLRFSYPGRQQPVLRGLNLTVEPGDRILLEGASGSGKSTLVSVLNQLRQPDSGLLLLSGLDPASVGSLQWRSRVSAVPQHHENFVFNDSMAYNLLLGRGWPPAPDDLLEAETLCQELGLGDLLERMPGGLGQVVGETGWRLSHGERSRVLLARALLQGADVIIADESLAALDPKTLELTFRCLHQRAPSLLLIAHP